MSRVAGLVSKRLVAVSLAAALAPAPGRAIVGGAANEGALARASVMVLLSNGGVCSGVVLAPEAVLTAAHCVAGAAEHRVHFRGGDGAPVLIPLAAKAIHPGYDAGAVQGRRRSIDLAIVRPAEPLPAVFRPATLSEARPEAGVALEVGGYGASREGDPRSTGTFRLATLRAVAPYGPSSILVWAKGDGAGACRGDSGGPITAGSGVLAAATWSTGTRGACGDLTQGVLLGPQRAWIDRTLGAWGLSARWG